MFCTHCGNQLPDAARSCTRCGQKTDAAVSLPLPQGAEAVSGILVPASQGKRFANYLLDAIGFWIFAAILGFVLALVGFFDLLENMNDVVLGLILVLGYYVFFEGIWSKTPAKWITKTHVVMEDGSKPAFGNIMGRTLARLIPFEPFSFFGKQPPRGWHDRLSKTLVIDDR